MAEVAPGDQVFYTDRIRGFEETGEVVSYRAWNEGWRMQIRRPNGIVINVNHLICSFQEA